MTTARYPCDGHCAETEPVGFFRWGSQWGYSWPVKLIRGHDEHHRRTVGIITWAGSIFFAWPCKDQTCMCREFIAHQEWIDQQIERGGR